MKARFNSLTLLLSGFFIWFTLLMMVDAKSIGCKSEQSVGSKIARLGPNLDQFQGLEAIMDNLLV
jgi:hypothetical protein